LKPDGSVGPKRLLHDFGKQRGIDGMCVDVEGNIYGAAGSGETGASTSSTLRVNNWRSSDAGGTDQLCLRRQGAQDAVRDGGQVAVPHPAEDRGFAVFWPKMARAETATDPVTAAVERSLPRIEQGPATTSRTGNVSAAITRRCPF